ncbi:MAG TPA: universal stress protein [Pilimelia sp.]|nr:universal stress protein [Pilimelia sp.]
MSSRGGPRPSREHRRPGGGGARRSATAADTVAAAFEVAAARAAGLVAIRAYQPPTPPWGTDLQPLVYDPEKREADEHGSLNALLQPWRDKYPQTTVEALVARGSAAQVLVGVSHTAQLVVVGSHGHGGFTGTLLGSVGQQLLHHADCPVLITRPAP